MSFSDSRPSSFYFISASLLILVKSYDIVNYLMKAIINLAIIDFSQRGIDYEWLLLLVK